MHRENIEVPQIVKEKLRGVRRRRAMARLVETIVIPVTILIATMLLVMAVDWMLEIGAGWRVITSATALVAAGAAAGWGLLRLLEAGRTLSSAARDVDRAVPSLGERWSTIAELSESPDPREMKGAPSLIGKVSDEAVAMAHLVEERNIVSRQTAYRWAAGCVGAAVVVLLAFVIWPGNMSFLSHRFFAPLSNIPFTRVTSLTGDKDVPKFEPLAIEASVGGKVRDWATLQVRTVADKKVKEVALVHDEHDKTKYKYTLRSVDEPLEYRIESGDGRTPWHKVTPIERPSFAQIRFKVTPPEYTKLATDQKDSLPRQYRAVEGSRLEIEFLASKPLKDMKLQAGKDRTIELTRGEGDWYRYVTSLKDSVTLAATMTDQHGLNNLTPATSNITVYADQPPTVAITAPNDSVALPPDDKVKVEFKANDDFGISKAELVLEISPPPPAKVGESATTNPAEGEASNSRNGDPTDPSSQKPEQQHANVGATTNPSEGADSKNQPDAKVQAGAKNPADAQDQANAKNPAGANDQANAKNPTDAQKQANAKNPAGDEKRPAEAQASAPKDSQKGAAGQPAATHPASQQPITRVIPIPLDPNNPQKNLKRAMELDLKPFNLKTGQEVKYSIRVTDTRMAEATSGQPTPSQPKDSQNQPNQQNAQSSQNPQNPSAQNGATTNPSDPKAQANAATTQPDSKTAAATQPGGAQANATSTQPSDAQAKASTQPSNPSQNQDNRIAQSSHPSKPPKGDSEPSKSEIPPKPPENITTRWAPFPQSANSNKRSIKVDEWAGTAGNDVRAKLEIAIDKYLADLEAALAAAQTPTDALKLHVAQKLNWTPAEDAKLVTARKSAADASAVVSDAVKKTAGTPYAFMGLQLGDIGLSHVDPARKHLAAATNLKDNAAEQLLQLDRAAYHISQARTRLANLTREYEAVKKDNKLADAMQHLQKLHQMYMKDTMAALVSGKPKLNPMNRKIQEISDELAKKIAEGAEKAQKLKAELAAAMAKDPELVRRMMARMRQEGVNLRDVFTLQERQQQEQFRHVAEWTDTPADRRRTLKDQLRAKELANAAETAEHAARLDDNMKVWVPRKADVTKGSLAKAQTLSTEIALAAVDSARMMRDGRDLQSSDAANLAAEKIRKLNDHLNGALFQTPDDADLKRYVDFRKVESGKLAIRLGLYIERNKALRGDDFARYARIEQTRLMTETLELQTKLLPVGRMYTSVPPIAAKAKQLDTEITEDVVNNQQAASAALTDHNLKLGRSGEARAVEGYAKAAKTFDELRKLIVDFEDAKGIPPNAGAGALPTLEELLAQLEKEKKALEGLLDCMPVNIAVSTDWASSAQGAMGSGMSGDIGMSAGQAAQRAQQAAQKLGQQIGKPGPPKEGGPPVSGIAKLPDGKETRAWDIYVSTLQKDLRQVRGNSPPDEYRQAIEDYMRVLAEETSNVVPKPPAEKK